MNGNKKALTLMNFAKSDAVSARSKLFKNEIDWVFAKSGSKPDSALFIGFAYKGANYATYFKDVSDIFLNSGITLTDIKSGDPATLIAAAKAIIIGGGDAATLINFMNGLITPTFNPYVAIKNRIDAAVPFIGWNEGSNIVSPKYLNSSINPVSTGISGSPFQIVCDYSDSAVNRGLITDFLRTNPTVKKLISQPAEEFMPDGTAVRLEEAGGGMIESSTAPFPIVIRFALVDGGLVAS